MKRRIILLFFVALFAVLSCTYGLKFFEDSRDRKGLERKTRDFSPEHTLAASLFTGPSDPQKMAEELMDLADRLDGDIVLQASSSMYSANPVEMPPVFSFVYSNKIDLFAANVFSAPEVNWGRSAKDLFSLKEEPGLGKILTIRDLVDGEDINLGRSTLNRTIR